MTIAERIPTMEQVALAAYEAWTALEPVLYRVAPYLDRTTDLSSRRILSDLIGTWQRIPIHSAFFLVHRPLPHGNPENYWIAEWDVAPPGAFILALQGAFAGHQAFLRHLDPTLLEQRTATANGTLSLGHFLMSAYDRTRHQTSQLLKSLPNESMSDGSVSLDPESRSL